MRDHFIGFYRPTEEQFLDLWTNCTFILDTNVLLNLYRYPKKARDDLLRVLQEVSDRLWIPHQVALEYQEKRLGVIAEQVKRYDEAEKVLREIEEQLKANLGKLQLKKRHSLIDPEGFLKKMNTVLGEFVRELEGLRKQQPDVYDEDELRNQIDSLLEGKIGPAPGSQEELDKIYKEGEKRYEKERPPGYMDIKKADSDKEGPYLYGGLLFRREYGDLILWYQIIKQAQLKDGFNKIIFLTDDNKEDWWWIVQSQGEKVIGPRPELVDEICSKADVSLFYMYNSERFMQFAEKHLGIQIEKESIKQVRDIAQIKRREEQPSQWESMREMHRVAYNAVLAWLRSSHPNDKIKENEPKFPDFIRLGHQDEHSHGYELKVIRHPLNAHRIARETLYRGYYEVKEGRLDTFKLILVVDGELDTLPMRKTLRRLDIPPDIKIEVFGLTADAEDTPVVRFMYRIP